MVSFLSDNDLKLLLSATSVSQFDGLDDKIISAIDSIKECQKLYAKGKLHVFMESEPLTTTDDEHTDSQFNITRELISLLSDTDIS